MSETFWKKQGFKSLSDYQMCNSLQKLISNVKDPESLFSDIEFIRNITGCKILTKKPQKEK